MPLYTLYELLIYIFWLSFAKALLLHRDIQPFAEYAVAPLVGAWIETYCVPWYLSGKVRRTPRGCVD